MGLLIVTAITNDGDLKGLCRGRLVRIDCATIYPHPSAAKKAMETAMSKEHAYSPTKWKVEDWSRNYDTSAAEEADYIDELNRGYANDRI